MTLPIELRKLVEASRTELRPGYHWCWGPPLASNHFAMRQMERGHVDTCKYCLGPEDSDSHRCGCCVDWENSLRPCAAEECPMCCLDLETSEGISIPTQVDAPAALASFVPPLVEPRRIGEIAAPKPPSKMRVSTARYIRETRIGFLVAIILTVRRNMTSTYDGWMTLDELAAEIKSKTGEEYPHTDLAKVCNWAFERGQFLRKNIPNTLWYCYSVKTLADRFER